MSLHLIISNYLSTYFYILALLNQQSKGKKKLQLSATDFMKKKRTSISSSASGDSSSGLVTNSLPSPTDNISPNDDPSNKV